MSAPSWEDVWKVLAEYLPLENTAMAWEADPEDMLESLGATELTRLEIAVALEDAFDFLVCEKHTRTWTTVASVIQYAQTRWAAERKKRGGVP